MGIPQGLPHLIRNPKMQDKNGTKEYVQRRIRNVLNKKALRETRQLVEKIEHDEREWPRRAIAALLFMGTIIIILSLAWIMYYYYFQ